VADSLTDLAGLKVRAEDFLAAVLEAAAQPIWVVDPDGLIRFANPAAIAALGYDSADELFGRHSHETIHHRHPDGTPYPAADCPMLLPRLTGETVARDLDWFFRRDGSMFPVSYVSVPIEMPGGRGAVVAFADIEDRLRAEQLLEERDAVLAAQQAALRRVATLVAGGAASAKVVAAIAKEVGHVIGLPLIAVWRYEADGTTATVIGAWCEQPHPFQPGTRWPLDGPTICAQVRKTGGPARIEDFAVLPRTIADAARKAGIRSVAGAPIIVDGDLWGAMSAISTDPEPLPDHIEDRLAEFTELVATAISNTASRAEVARLADEQAALRRVATLVARGVPPADVFAAVAREVGLLLGVEATHMARYEPDETATGVAAWSPAGEQIPVGTRVDLEGESVAGLVFRTGKPARMQGYEHASGVGAALGRELGLRSSVGAPIIVDQRLWGVMIASSKGDRPLPADAESRIAAFTELVATAISNTEARAQVAQLADEQTALRRVATLVAQGVPSSELFGAVTEEVGRLLAADLAGMIRYETDDTVSPVATWAAVGEHPEVPNRWATEEGDPAMLVATTRRPARVDDWHAVPGPIAAFIRELGITSSVGSPILVDGRLWGALAVHSKRSGGLPADTETRLGNFTELVATAMSNAQARAEVHRLADEQAALRRVATLIALESPPAQVFAAVAEELERLLRIDVATMLRYDGDETATVVADRGGRDGPILVGARMSLEGDNVTGLVLRTGRPARIDDYANAAGSLGTAVRGLGVRSAVGCPIVVGGQLWGVIVAGTREAEPLPVGLESRIRQFTELVATAISNLQARSDLAASRARIVAATDDERRRVVRDLHDGAQQRLVHTVITLKLARQALLSGEETGPALVSQALDHAQQATVELRELAHGIIPGVLAHGGLRAGVAALAARMAVPVEIDVSVGRLPREIEATAYFVVAEALTNVAKHARAGHAEVTARSEDGTLTVQVRDDGVGGVRPEGSGLVGLADRLAALDGRLRIDSPAEGGTLVAAAIPVPCQPRGAPPRAGG
jgi:PAS domain S-box-containing protein